MLPHAVAENSIWNLRNGRRRRHDSVRGWTFRFPADFQRNLISGLESGVLLACLGRKEGEFPRKARQGADEMITAFANSCLGLSPFAIRLLAFFGLKCVLCFIFASRGIRQQF